MSKLFITISLIFLFQLCIFFSLSGQGFLINQVKTIETRNALINKSYKDIEGSPYNSNTFTEGMAYLKDGNFASLSLRYDIFQDEMEFRKGENIRWLNKNDIKYIRSGTDMIFVSSADGDTSKLGYFFLKNSGKYLLFYRKIVNYLPSEPPKGYATAIPDRFVSGNDEIFIKAENMPAKKIKNKKDLFEFFDNDKTVLDHIKKKKIKANNLEDLNELVSFLNGI